MTKTKNEPPANQEVPLVNGELERSLLAAVIDSPELLKSIQWYPDYFALDANKWVARAIERVATRGALNTTNVAIELKDVARLEQVGGTKYLGELQDSCAYKMPEDAIADVQSWFKQLRQLHEKRCLLAEARSLVALLATNATEDHFEAFKRTTQRVEQLKPRDEARLGFWLTELGDLNEDPPPETWLLIDNLTDKPALPLSRTWILAASGGTGKTTTLVQLAVCVALGLIWCGFKVATPGMVCLCCGESDKKLIHRQVWRAMNLLELTPEERAICQRRVFAYGLSGAEVSIVQNTQGNNIERTEFLERFKRELCDARKEREELFSLVILDPLSRFAGPDSEKDNAAATRFVQALETLTSLPGEPSVVCAHHSSKNSLALGKPDSRGATGIRDGVRSQFILTRHKCENVVGVHMVCDKSNEAPHFQDRWLVQEQGRKGGTLRLATEPEAAILEASAHPKKKPRGGFAEPLPPTDKQTLQDALLDKIRQLGGSVRSRDWMMVNHMTGWRKTEMIAGFRDLIELGLITVETNGKNRGTVWLTEQSRQAEIPFSRSEETGTNHGNEVCA